ncbi:MAG: hypothetical protein L7W43_06185, partial [Rubripirellula sp.]|nr:hypothetical protein [Rubripirellula sp.]
MTSKPIRAFPASNRYFAAESEKLAPVDKTELPRMAETIPQPLLLVDAAVCPRTNKPAKTVSPGLGLTAAST